MTQRLPEAHAWQALARHHADISNYLLTDLFAEDPGRAERYAIEAGPLYLDFSKNHLTDTTLDLFAKLADASGLAAARDQLFQGHKVNVSEDRAALHTALRADDTSNVAVDVSAAIARELERMTKLYESLRREHMTSFSNDAFDTIVNIGIGGSDLGPRLLSQALGTAETGFKVHFVANLDPSDLTAVLADCRAETTLFVVSSKSFGTLETLANFRAARHWLHAAGCDEQNMSRHFLAATANAEAATAAGIDRAHIFHFWDWVGGRYSVWSAAALGAFLAVGPPTFKQFLAGAHRIDQHFNEADWRNNLPVILGLISVWYTNYFNCHGQAIVPYEQRLALLPDYLCQLAMESNGKSVTRDGQPVGWHTAPITWGGIGSNVQHSFFQALHQGTRMIPVDFLTATQGNDDRNRDLLLSCLAQSRALMCGDNGPESYRHYPGNRPSNTLLYESLDAETLGALLAVYEHRTFVQAQLWQVNPFDQWGVELGKTMTRQLGRALEDEQQARQLDSSTRTLLLRYRQHCNKR